ncbi:Flp pilus assembly complex ATPase component TadA [Roseibacillus ishigakijimensis]|uniref:Flp pilus assembly complex ATPase component TadA n=2 Tax=Roseibacillus ishigakijimensis TaxID=454146 RepID=A0A934VL95_9BACT|nr:ATPase, T2SS/T4P/T4SS family [Roseibacillus ishigakijimensis]MBK1832997.1 Flp pilus assembly complex ATPase component TadA [Roseibacillus ishigakijimensis]
MYSNQDYLSQLLVEAGMVSPEVVDEIKRSGTSEIVDRLLMDGAVNESQVTSVIAQNASMEVVDLSEYEIPQEVAAQMTSDVAKRFQAVPVHDDGNQLMVAIADGLNFEVLDSLPHAVGREINPVLANLSDIRRLLVDVYRVGAADEDDIPEFEVLTMEGVEEVSEEDAPIVRIVTTTLMNAFKQKASDIHIEPLETTLRVRFRVDGKLVEVENHPKKLLPAVVARLKVMSGSMSIAEKRLPQDGRIQMRIAGKSVDLRVSTVPSNHGESVVMRILDKSALTLGLPELGFLSDDEATFKEMLALPDGILLVTGPTGSGKTTTLYACLNEINRPDKKIITVEDPVEYQLAGINQVMVKTDVGMTFAAALRSMLRQAPNIIMVGEIRDKETATIAMNASLTGHLVFSTLHTNDATSTVARLADMGIKRFLIASAVRAVLAQRLVRQLCPSCKAPVPLTEREMRILNIDRDRAASDNILGPIGCEKCRQGGYKGRKGIFEIFKVDDEVRNMINDDLSSPELRKRARELGMRTLREDGIRKVLGGMTSAEEVIRVTMADEN